MRIKILVADGDGQIRNELKKLLCAEGYEIDLVSDGISVIKHFRRYDYDLAILDIILPELDGKSVCRQIRKMSEVPFVILSSSLDEDTKLKCYELGAEDYITKPFSQKELLARIKVIIRRGTGKKEQYDHERSLKFDGLSIDTFSHTVFIDDRKALLTPKEYQLLLLLAKNPNQVFSREKLLDEVWGNDYYGTDRTVDTHIKTLREALRPRQDYISTVRGYGYRFNEAYDDSFKK